MHQSLFRKSARALGRSVGGPPRSRPRTAARAPLGSCRAVDNLVLIRPRRERAGCKKRRAWGCGPKKVQRQFFPSRTTRLKADLVRAHACAARARPAVNDHPVVCYPHHRSACPPPRARRQRLPRFARCVCACAYSCTRSRPAQPPRVAQLAARPRAPQAPRVSTAGGLRLVSRSPARRGASWARRRYTTQHQRLPLVPASPAPRRGLRPA